MFDPQLGVSLGPRCSQTTAHLSTIGEVTADVGLAAVVVASIGASMTSLSCSTWMAPPTSPCRQPELLPRPGLYSAFASQAFSKQLAARCFVGCEQDLQGCRSDIEHFRGRGDPVFSRIQEGRCAGAGFWYVVRSLPPCAFSRVARFLSCRSVESLSMSKEARDVFGVPGAHNLDQSAW